MEMVVDNSVKLMDNGVNMSYSNSSVLWDDFFTTSSYTHFTVARDSVSVVTNVSTTNAGSGGSVFESDLIIPLYVVIFVLAIVGNSLVLITLAQNKRMRTVTNVYLLNLVSYFKLILLFSI
jgi:cholecystokinin-like receptor